jgi:hypothetical protein
MSEIDSAGYLKAPPPVRTNESNAEGAATGSAKNAAMEQAANVGHQATQSGQHLADVARDQASAVAGEAGAQVKDLVSQAQLQVSQQTAVQQQKLVTGLRSLSDELAGMSQGSESPGIATDFARQAGERTSALAGWLDGREPSSLLNDVSAFARRRPGAFLGIAVGLGLLAGRLTRGLQADSKQTGTADTGNARTPTLAQPTPPSLSNGDLSQVSPSITGVAVTDGEPEVFIAPVLPTAPAAT